jgi:predicted acetyltransferase
VTETFIRQLEGDAMLEVRFALNTYAFRASPQNINKTEWKEIVRNQKGITYLALYEDERPAAAVAATTMTQQVRGALFPASGVWGVAAAPWARRKGYARRLLSQLLAITRQDGRVFSGLYPFRESFYERLGYITFPLPRIVRFAPSALAPLLKKDLSGKVELVTLADGFELYRGYLKKQRQGVHGMLVYDEGDPSMAQHTPSWLALARIDGEIAGMMLYTLKGDAIAEFELHATRFYYQSSQAKYLLLQWIALHTDQANRVKIELAPYEQPETWLSDLQVKIESAVRAPMGRILDVARLSGMRVGPGSFTASLQDDFCPWNSGAWQFLSQDGRLQARPAQSTDCKRTTRGLSGLVYACHNPADFGLRGWGEVSLETQQAMLSLFPPLLPFMHEEF